MMTLLKTIDVMPSALEQASQKLHECRYNNSCKNCRKSKKNCTKERHAHRLSLFLHLFYTPPLPTGNDRSFFFIACSSKSDFKFHSISVILRHFLRRVIWCLYVSFDLSMCSMIKCTVYTEVFLQHYIALQHPYFQRARNILRAALLHAGCPHVISKRCANNSPLVGLVVDPVGNVLEIRVR